MDRWKHLLRNGERDNHKCVLCGTRHPLCVHHKDQNKANNQENNLMTLCYRCHPKEHKRMGLIPHKPY